MIKWVYRNVFHYIAGLLAGWIATKDFGVAALLVFCFFGYQLAQDWRKGDCSFRDILEFVVCFYVVVGGLFIWEVIK